MWNEKIEGEDFFFSFLSFFCFFFSQFEKGTADLGCAWAGMMVVGDDSCWAGEPGDCCFCSDDDGGEREICVSTVVRGRFLDQKSVDEKRKRWDWRFGNKRVAFASPLYGRRLLFRGGMPCPMPAKYCVSAQLFRSSFAPKQKKKESSDFPWIFWRAAPVAIDWDC